MTNGSVSYEIREDSTPDGGVALELVVEGSTVARASASQAILDDLRAELGFKRDAVVEELRRSLVGVLKTQEQFVEIKDIKEDPDHRLRFVACYTHRLREEISTGVVWYDVSESTTGPEAVPPVVRNKMRSEVYRKLTPDRTAARSLIDLHK